jgi:hypothetical protein
MRSSRPTHRFARPPRTSRQARRSRACCLPISTPGTALSPRPLSGRVVTVAPSVAPGSADEQRRYRVPAVRRQLDQWACQFAPDCTRHRVISGHPRSTRRVSLGAGHDSRAPALPKLTITGQRAPCRAWRATGASSRPSPWHTRRL